MPAPKDPIKRAEWKANMSAVRKGRPSPLKGKTIEEFCKNPEEARANNSAARKKYYREHPDAAKRAANTPEAKANNKAANKKYHQEHPNAAKERSNRPEARANNSAAVKKYYREHPNPNRPTEVIPGQIPLTRNLYAFCDLEDYEELMKHKWNAERSNVGTFYAQAIIDNQNVKMSNFLLRPAPGVIIDHIDRNPLNNHRLNLRPATKQENNWNRRPSRTMRGRPCSSQFKGVWRVRNTSTWKAGITRDGVLHPLGTFTIEEDAARAYDRAARHYFGEFAYQNFPEEEL